MLHTNTVKVTLHTNKVTLHTNTVKVTHTNTVKVTSRCTQTVKVTLHINTVKVMLHTNTDSQGHTAHKPFLVFFSLHSFIGGVAYATVFHFSAT